jgi:hypothetical protein
VTWLRSLVAGLSPRRPGFAPASIHIGFVMDKVALGQVFLRVLRFPLSIYAISFHRRSPNSYNLGNANLSRHPRLGTRPTPPSKNSFCLHPLIKLIKHDSKSSYEHCSWNLHTLVTMSGRSNNLVYSSLVFNETFELRNPLRKWHSNLTRSEFSRY